MITGTGIDIVEIERIQRIHDKYKGAFAEKILCDAELEEYRASKFPAHFLAKRFSAKEAVVKALGTGVSKDITLKMICVGHDELGRPTIILHGGAKQRADEQGADVSWISISDEKLHAVAFVVMESLK